MKKNSDLNKGKTNLDQNNVINKFYFLVFALYFLLYFTFNLPWTIEKAHEFLGNFSFWFSCRYRGKFAFLFLLIFKKIGDNILFRCAGAKH